MEWFNTLIDGIARFLKDDIDFLNIGAYSPAVYIALGGIAVVLLAFFVALIAKGASKTVKFRKYLEDTTAYINALQTVDEENVDLLNARIQKMPVSVVKGWSNFLDQQTGYPSDYITEKDLLADRDANPPHKGGKGFYKLASAIVILIGIALAAISCKDMFVGITADKVMLIALAIGGALCGPLLVYIILLAILNGGYRAQLKKTVAAFRAFQDAVDNTVVLFREEQDEFISENIEEINATIEEILANKLDNKELIEIVTTPKVDEALAMPEEEPVAEPAPVEVPAPAEVAEPVPAKPAPAEEIVATDAKSEEVRRGERLLLLVSVADRASRDKSITSDQLVELAEVLYEAKNSGTYNSQDEQAIFDDCLRILSSAYYG